jgi:threonine dehydratase
VNVSERLTLEDGRSARERIRASLPPTFVAEASGALGLAALRSGRVRPADGRPVVAVVTGGKIDARVLTRLLAART